MHKIEEQTTVTVDVLGTPVEVAGPSGMVGRVAQQWSRCRTTAEPTHHVELLTWLEPDIREYTLVSGLNLLGIQMTAGQRVNLHAAGLSGPDGRVAALVAASGTGKTTAARVLGTRLGYVTDECVSVDPASLAVLPYPKPLSVVVAPPDSAVEAAQERKRQVGPDELGLAEPEPSLRLGAVILLDRTETSGTPTLTSVDLVDALEVLAPQTSSAAVLPHPLHTLAGLVARTGGVHRLTYAEIADATELITTHLASVAPQAERHVHVPGAPGGALEWPGHGLLVAAAHHDAVVAGDTALVMTGGGRLVRASGAAATVWTCVQRGESASGARLTGPAIATAIDQLRAAGLLADLTSQGPPAS